MANPYPFGPLRPLCHVVLDRPRIFHNVAACVRLCANLGAALHLCGPFPESWRGPMPSSAARAGLDYWAHCAVTTHDDLARCLHFLQRPCVVVEVDGDRAHFDAPYDEGDVLVFGPEDGSVPAGVEQKARVVLPSSAHTRSLNLSQCVAVVGYEVLRQVSPAAL